MNVSIVYSSLKYINNNFKLIVKLSNFINSSLIQLNYKDKKLNKALKLKDFDVIKNIINLVEDEYMLIDNVMKTYINDFYVIKLKKDYILIHSSRFDDFDIMNFICKDLINFTCEEIMEAFCEFNY
jgi:hypothetical protein